MIHRMDEDMENYLCRHSDAEPALLAELSRETHVRFLNPRMASGHLQGRLLVMLCRMIHPRKVLELGTFTGYATLCLAEGVEGKAPVHTIERNDELEDHLHQWFARSPYGDCIQVHFGQAQDIVPTLDGPFDLVFLDVDKRHYQAVYELALAQMPSGGFLLADNTLWNDTVLHDPAANDVQALAVASFNEAVAADERVEKVMLPVRDGLTLIRKK